MHFGLVAMAAAVTGFVALFSELGLTSATVQRGQVDQDMVSGLFFIGLGISIVLVPIVCAFAPIAVWFFNDPRVSGLIMLMSLSFPLAALGSQHTALLAAFDALDDTAMDRPGRTCGGRIRGHPRGLEDGPRLLVARGYDPRCANRHAGR